MRISLLSLSAAVITLCASCATQSETIPTVADLEASQKRFRVMAQPQFDDLERRRASGTLSQADYQREKSTLEYSINQQAVDAAWTAHALAESDRKATGIPTPDQPQQAQVGNISGSLYQSHNDQYGSAGGLGGGSATGSGYQSGGSLLGNAGRRTF